MHGDLPSNIPCPYNRMIILSLPIRVTFLNLSSVSNMKKDSGCWKTNERASRNEAKIISLVYFVCGLCRSLWRKNRQLGASLLPFDRNLMRTPTPCQHKDASSLLILTPFRFPLILRVINLQLISQVVGERLSWIPASRSMCPLKENKNNTSSRDGNCSERPWW